MLLPNPRTAGSFGAPRAAPPPPLQLARCQTRHPQEEELALEVWTVLAGSGVLLWQQAGSEVLLLQHCAAIAVSAGCLQKASQIREIEREALLGLTFALDM